MAKIPVGNFGNVIAQPAPRVRVPAGAYDTGGGLQQASQALMGVATDIMREERQQEEQLTRAKAANAILDREISVDAIRNDIEQQVTSGTLHYGEAKKTYQTRISELTTPEIPGLDPAMTENLNKGFKRVEFRGETNIDGLVSKARVADFRAQTDGILDKLGKQAGLPNSDMSALGAQLDAMDEIGRRAYGAGWDKRKQDWKDNSWDARLNQEAMGVRNSMGGIKTLQKQITEGDYADKLDSNRRNALIAKLDGYHTSLVQRQEAAAARAARQQELALKKAEAEFNTFQGLADKGTILSPEYIDAAIKKTAGTPYQAGIAALAQQARETGGIASQPLNVQQATLDAIDRQIAQQGRTPALDKRREQVQKVLAGSRTDVKENGLRAGLERGVITDIAPIDISSPDAIAGSLSARIQQADQVSQWAGKPVSPLDAAEADQLRSTLEALPAKQRSAAVATVAKAVGPRYAAAIAEQLDSKDRALSLAFATSDAKTTNGRFTSELIIKGATAIKDGTAMKDDNKVTGWKASIAKEIDGVFPDERSASAVKDAAYYIAAGIAHENGGSVSGDEIRRAVRLAVGGSIIERNGRRLPIPAGLDAGEFDDRLKNVSPTAITRQAADGKVRLAGGAEMDATEFAASIPGQELMPAGSGRYAVIVNGRPVTNTKGKPILIEVR